MKKSEIYYYGSMVSLLATFATGLGIIISIVLLVLISSEKKLSL